MKKNEINLSEIKDRIVGLFNAFKAWFNAQPGWLKVIMYSGVSSFLGLLQRDLRDGKLNWRDYLLIIVVMLINVTAYLLLNEKKRT